MANQFSREASTHLRLPKPTLWPTLHPKLIPMSSQTNTPATTTTLIWTEIKKVYKAKVSAISRSKSRTDGCPSQMVGDVSFSALAVCDWQFLPEFDLLRPLRYPPPPARVLPMPLHRIRKTCWPAARRSGTSHSLRRLPSHFSHDLHHSSTLVGQQALTPLDHS